MSSDALTARLEEAGLWEAMHTCASQHGASVSAMFSARKTARLCLARTRAYLYLRALGWSYPEIGDLFGRDHTTIMSAVKPKRCGPIPDLVPAESTRVA